MLLLSDLEPALDDLFHRMIHPWYKGLCLHSTISYRILQQLMAFPLLFTSFSLFGGKST